MSAPSPALRVAAAAASVAGLVTLAGGGVTRPPVAAAAAVLVVASATASARFTGPTASATRRRAGAALLGGAALVTLALGTGQHLESLGTLLGLLLCAAAVAHAFVLDTVRDLRLHVAIPVSMLVLAAGVAPGLVIAGPVLLTWACVVTALVLAASDAEGSAATARAVVDRPATAGRAAEARRALAPVAAVVVVAMLGGLALALVLPHPAGLTAVSRSSAQAAAASAGQQAARETDAYLGDGPLDLDARGTLSDQPIADVTSAVGAPAAQLWRAGVLTTYDGHSWTSPDDGAQLLGEGTTAAVPADPRSPTQPHATTRTDAVTWLADVPPVVLSPGIATSVALRAPAPVIRETTGRLLVLSPDADPAYAVTSEDVPSVDDLPVGTGTTARARSASAKAAGADETDPVWVSLPATVPQRVRALAASITAGTGGRVAAAVALETYLRGTERYDLRAPVAAPDEDTVDDFLFRTHAGFCEQFATAEVVMLRSLGIPARVVTGFAADAPEAGGTTVLRASDAHAWVELWVPGTGWVSSDPTAGSIPVTTSAAPSALHRVVHALTASTAAKVVLAVVLAAGAVLAALLPGRRRVGRTWAQRRARPGRGTDPVAAAAPLLAAFARLESALDRAGRARAPAESVRALGARLAHEEGGADPAGAGALLVLERAAYAGRPPGATELHAAAEDLDRATARLLAATRTPTPSRVSGSSTATRRRRSGPPARG